MPAAVFRSTRGSDYHVSGKVRCGDTLSDDRTLLNGLELSGIAIENENQSRLASVCAKYGLIRKGNELRKETNSDCLPDDLVHFAQALLEIEKQLGELPLHTTKGSSMRDDRNPNTRSTVSETACPFMK